MSPPSHARAVVIGGGVAGCSVAYHLAQRGWREVVLLERRKLTSGTTWHAAGLIGQLRGNANMTRLAKYSTDLYTRLGAETGVETGFRRVGSISTALTPDRFSELRRSAAMARAFDVDVTEVGPSEIKALYPHLNTDGVVGGVHLPGDGQADPANIALALAKGARMGGAAIHEGVRVTGIDTAQGRVSAVRWRALDGAEGIIATDIVINCAGMWGRDLAAASGVTLPLHACEHFYIVTEPVPGLGHLPVLRVPDECAYYKSDAGKLMLGAFEPKAKPWGMDGIREDFEFDTLPEDWDHFAPILEAAVKRMPILETVGIHTFFNGPESFTPDNRYYLGEAPELPGYWVAAGFNSVGIQSAGGAGMAVAAWIDEGQPPFDLSDVDIRRVQPFQRNRRYLKERVSETLGLLYADHWPYRQVVTARGIRRSPLHEALKARGAVFGEVAGWERANWFAAPGQAPEYRYGWGRPNWWANQRAEHMAVRTNAGLFDMTSFGKIRIEGPGALALLQRVCANQIDVPAGRIVYTQMLNARGGIEADVTVARLSETAFVMVTAGANLQRDLAWLRRHKGDDIAIITDITSAEAVLVLMGPQARKVLGRITPDRLDNDAFPYGTAREIEVGMAIARAHRVSYVGELGWELYVPTEMAAHVFEALIEAAPDLTLCGLHTLDSCRIEKAFRHFGHDITDEDHVLEAGLGFAVRPAKGDFIGREAVLRAREAGVARRLVQFRLDDPDPSLFHHEPILRDGRIVGTLTSANYGHHLGGAVGLGYVPAKGMTEAEVLAGRWEIDIAGVRVPATASLAPMYDPTAERVRL
jgi:4-methylaminobutanoate oxidase (formaldehyde-forming)